jgi:cytochrome c-type biogenesis protein CcmH/NrfG
VPSLRAPMSCLVLALVLACGGCIGNGYYVNRGLHYVRDDDGNEQLVRSNAPPPGAYEAYLRARLALDRNPPLLDEARGHILDALRWQDGDPQLWTVLADIEWQLGNFAAAEQAIDRALALRPGYPEAERLLASMREHGEL